MYSRAEFNLFRGRKRRLFIRLSVFGGCWELDAFEPRGWRGPFSGSAEWKSSFKTGSRPRVGTRDPLRDKPVYRVLTRRGPQRSIVRRVRFASDPTSLTGAG